jgi:ribosomal-protein-alanine N-acetyltransferase
MISILTPRLHLRPFTLADSQRVQFLAGNSAVAETTASLPHPYKDGIAEEWIKLQSSWANDGTAYVFAVTLRENAELIGCIDLSGISKSHSKAELGYWIGVNYWNQGYCTEAADAIVRFGFVDLKLNKITSRHMTSNPSSGRVMKKIGMKREGVLSQEYRKGETFHDIEVYGILKSNYKESD